MDLSRAITLKNSDQLIDVEENFKLCAGPGAGKTRFLVNHIKNVINKSSRLSKVRKIACITYTNIGVETILKRLDNAIDFVEVSTIHSFLYKHIIKPYLWILEDEYEIPLVDIDGHDEIVPRISIIREWLRKTKQQYIRDYDKLQKELIKVKWIMNDDNTFVLKPDYPFQSPIKHESLLEYKKECWKNALISHGDVLYLAYRILEKQPRVLEILRAKFPYIFIDEFQDTSPIQSKIMKMIGEKETKIGVVGDVGQSIYSFQGADVEKFIEFDLDYMTLYKIENNYRSTEQIINILNYVRDESDFKQFSPKRIKGEEPIILVGTFFEVYKKAVELSNGQEVCSLTYTNDISNMMKFGVEKYFDITDINEPLFRDGKRGWMISYVITSIEYCRQNKLKEALKYMLKAYRKHEYFTKGEALLNLKRLINDYDKYKSGNIKTFYNNYLYGYYGVKQKITRGKQEKYYKGLDYNSIAIGVKINDDNSLHRTIHKAKGDQFENVMLIIHPKKDAFDEDKELSFLLNPSIDVEDNRVYYVALSRAKENLFINIPSLSDQNKDKLEKVGFIVEKVN